MYIIIFYFVLINLKKNKLGYGCEYKKMVLWIMFLLIYMVVNKCNFFDCYEWLIIVWNLVFKMFVDNVILKV